MLPPLSLLLDSCSAARREFKCHTFRGLTAPARSLVVTWSLNMGPFKGGTLDSPKKPIHQNLFKEGKGPILRDHETTLRCKESRPHVLSYPGNISSWLGTRGSMVQQNSFGCCSKTRVLCENPFGASFLGELPQDADRRALF